MRSWRPSGTRCSIAGSMTWEITWALILGFALSAVVQALVSQADRRPAARRRPAADARRGAPGSAPRPRRAPTPRSRWPGRCSARAPASPRRWRSRSPPPTWSSSSGVILALLLGWQFTAGRVRRRPGHDRRCSPCCSGCSCAQRLLDRGPRAGRPRAGRLHGGPRGDGHVRARPTGSLLAPAAVAATGSPRCRTSSSWSGRPSCATW